MRAEIGATHLGFGCAALPGALSMRDAVALLATAYEGGIRHFDTARMYSAGESERVLGSFAQGRRDELVIVSKAGIAPASRLARGLKRLAAGIPLLPHSAPRFGRFDPKLIGNSVHTSLRQLNTERLDALLLHEILLAEVSDELKELIAEFKREGKIGKIGVATSVAETEALIAAHPDLCEVVQAPVDWLDQPRTLPAHSVLVIHSVLAGGSAASGGLERLTRAMHLNADGVTLFSSRNHDRIRRNTALLVTRPQPTPASRVQAPADTRTAVIIAAYNAEATLDRAVGSALAQPEAAEICIVDDCSKDQTAALARAWAVRDPRVRAMSLPVNAGPSAARNAAIAATSSPWITILDADDYLLEGRLAQLHRHVDVDGADFIADALLRALGDDTPAPPRAPLDPAPLSFTGFVLGNLGAETGPLDLGYLKPMFRRSFVEAHQLAYRTDMRLGEDYEFYARALALGARFLVCQPAGYVSVERAGSLSKAHGEHDLLVLRDCDDGLAAIPSLNPDERAALRRHWNSVDCRLQWRRLITAVKTRDVPSALSTFRSPRTIAYLAARLGEQVWVRGRKAASGWGQHSGPWPA